MDTKLTITIEDKDAIDEARGLPEKIEAQYNPAELTLDKAAQLAEQNIPGLDSPLLQFVRGQIQKLTVELTLDQASAPPNQPNATVEKRLQALAQLVKVQPKTHAAPRVRVTWGQGLSFKGVAESVQRKVTLFDNDGKPLRAVVTVAFREYRSLDEQLKELNLQSADQTKIAVLRAGDRLDVIAQREYGDPELWRKLAAHNGVEDPRRLTPGTVLQIPPRVRLERQ
ncbi:MAG: peptidoglycan-binding protein [Gemmatimonadota bacterium]